MLIRNIIRLSWSLRAGASTSAADQRPKAAGARRFVAANPSPTAYTSIALFGFNNSAIYGGGKITLEYKGFSPKKTIIWAKARFREVLTGYGLKAVVIKTFLYWWGFLGLFSTYLGCHSAMRQPRGSIKLDFMGDGSHEP